MRKKTEMSEEEGGNKEFIDEEIIKVICDAISSVFNLQVKFENSESKTVELKLESERDQANYNSIVFMNDKATSWCSQLIDQCLRGLLRLEKPYKYLVSCVMSQNNGAVLHSDVVMLFEDTDGMVSKTISINDLFFSITIVGLAIS